MEKKEQFQKVANKFKNIIAELEKYLDEREKIVKDFNLYDVKRNELEVADISVTKMEYIIDYLCDILDEYKKLKSFNDFN